MSPGFGTFGTSVLGRMINCFKQSIGLCCRQRYGCGCAVFAPSWNVTMLSVWWNMLVVIRIW